MFFKKRESKSDFKRPSLKWRLFAGLLTLFMIACAGVALYTLFVFLQMPSLDSMLKETRDPTITFIDKDGYEIKSINKIMGTPVSVQTLPPHVWQSIIAIEDKRFFDHGALDFYGIMRSVFSNLRSGRIVAGGSSLTQQTAKNIFLSRHKTMSRKIQELIISYWLENRFSKEQILNLYMNRVSLVRGYRGIDAAARELFQKTANDLSLAEAVQITAMLKAPTTYSPVRHPERNIKRARVILVEMVRQKYITLAQAQDAAANLYAVTPAPDTNVFRYWTDYVSDEITSILGDKIDSDVFVYTTLDSDLQEQIAAVINRKLNDYKDKSVTQSAAIAMKKDGAIRAMIGGRDYQESQFNRVMAMRQPGSTFKPIVYLVALENGMTPESMVNDSQFSIGDYNPQNYNEKYYGDIKLSTAFAKSVNSVPLKLTRQYGISTVLNMAGRMGVGSKLRREYSTVLGASEMTLLDLTTLYDVIWNSGYSVRSYSVTKIMTPVGELLYERNPSDAIKILNPDTVNYMTELLADVLKPGSTGNRAVSKNAVGGKTGTSNDYRDAWFIGRTNDLTIGVWAGNDNFTPMNNVTGGTLPAEIFKEITN